MPTQITVEFADQYIPFWDTVTGIDVTAFATLGDQIIYGDPDTPFGPATRGAGMLQDMYDTIKNVLETLTGDVADETYVPLGPFTPAIPTFGMAKEAFGNPLRNRPFIAVACQANYTWGLLNIPSRVDTWDTVPFKWVFQFTASAVGSASQSPAYNQVLDLATASGASPILRVLELHPAG